MKDYVKSFPDTNYDSDGIRQLLDWTGLQTEDFMPNSGKLISDAYHNRTGVAMLYFNKFRKPTQNIMGCGNFLPHWYFVHRIISTTYFHFKKSKRKCLSK